MFIMLFIKKLMSLKYLISVCFLIGDRGKSGIPGFPGLYLMIESLHDTVGKI